MNYFKKLYQPLFFILVILSNTIQAQSQDTKRADNLFQRLAYVKAAEAYLKLAESDKATPYVYKQLADCYYYTFKPQEATQWYQKAVDTEQDSETYFRYAQMLRAQGKHTEANKQMQKFAKKSPNDSRAKVFNQNPNFIELLLAKRPGFEVKPSSLNDENSDFGLQLFEGVGYFTSARNSARKTYEWTKEPYTDIYKASFNGQDFSFGSPELLESLSTKHNDGPICFSPDGNTAYFASESWLKNQYMKDAMNLKQGQVHLFKATKTAEGWSDVQALPFNSSGYSCANPSMSADGRTLYFSSNRPGGFGGIDIWQVSLSGNEFGEPINLGSAVNTPADESFPFITKDNNTLYFSSKGHQGFGGYDVFSYNRASKEVKNLGKPLNSEQDDFSFAYYPELEVGFVSSNRQGADNIFVATPICGVTAQVVVVDKTTNLPLSNATVALVDEKSNTVKRTRTNQNGVIVFELECNTNYALQADAEGYEPGAESIDATKTTEITVQVALESKPPVITDVEVILNPIFFDFNKSDITIQGAAELDKLVTVLNENPEMEIFAKSHTDNRGAENYNLRLSKRRAKATVKYVISKGISKNRITGEGFGESEPKVDCGENCTEDEHALNRRSEFLIVKKEE